MTTTDVPNDPLSRFALSVFTVNGLLMRSGEYVTRPLGQSSARWQVLGRAGYEPQTISQMARDIGNSRQSVQRIAHALVKDGLATYRDNPADRRAPLLELTRQGAAVLEDIYARDQEWSRDLMARLDPTQLTELAQALEHVGAIMQTYIEAHENEETHHDDDD